MNNARDLEATLRRFHRLGALARFLAPPPVPTHGDPDRANVLIDTTGTSTSSTRQLALAPRERDLTFFTGERFAAFLRTYFERAGRVRASPGGSLPSTSTAGSCRRLLATCHASCLSRAMSRNKRMPGEELQPYLPFPHESIASGVAAVAAGSHPLRDRGSCRGQRHTPERA